MLQKKKQPLTQVQQEQTVLKTWKPLVITDSVNKAQYVLVMLF